MAENTVLTVSLSILLKEHIDRHATTLGMSTSAFVREVIARESGYDLEAERKNRVETRGRPRKYATDEDRKQAARERTRERDDLTRRLLENHQRDQRRRDAAILEESLRRKGVI